MQIINIICSTLFVTLLLISNPVLSDSNSRSDIELELITFNDRYNEAVANYDTEGFISLYSEEALWISPDKAPVQGHDTPRKAFEFLVENEGKLTHAIDSLLISEDGLQAVMIGQADREIKKLELDATGTYLFVLKRINDDWEIVADMFNQHASK